MTTLEGVLVGLVVALVVLYVLTMLGHWFVNPHLTGMQVFRWWLGL